MSVKIALDKKRDELVTAEDSLAIQEAVLGKIKEKLAEKIEEKKGEIKEKVSGAAKEKILDTVRDEAAENAGETYSNLREKYEQGKKTLEILKAKRRMKAKEVGLLEDSYHACMQGDEPSVKPEEPLAATVTLPEREYFKATIVEDMLQDKKILGEFEIERTREVGGFKLHQVNFSREMIKDLQKSLAPGPAYVHVWKEDSDEVLIVFKEKIFTINNTDRSTWSQAIAYGMDVGVPEAQLDFTLIRQKPKGAKKK